MNKRNICIDSKVITLLKVACTLLGKMCHIYMPCVKRKDANMKEVMKYELG